MAEGRNKKNKLKSSWNGYEESKGHKRWKGSDFPV